MFGATVLAPLLMGFDPNVAILFSGIRTLVFFVAVGLVVMLAAIAGSGA
jgi:putative pyrimidine permease RutG